MNSSWHNIPFAPGRWPFFYGWMIVAVGTLGIMASIPGQIMGIGVFTDSLIETLKLKRTQLSLAYALGTITSSMILPFAGTLLDRIGVRIMMIVSAVGLALALVLMSQSDRIALVDGSDLFVLTFAVAMGCFFLIRFFGQGCLVLVSRVAIGKWFNHRRGLASAISGTCVAFAFIASPKLIDAMVQAWGWRPAYLALAAVVGVGMSLIAGIFFRENPEACGLVMDGKDDPVWHEKMAARVVDIRKEFTRKEAIRTISFWAFTLAISSQAIMMTSLFFHVTSLGDEIGLTRTQSYNISLPMSLVGAAANLLAGWISDRIKLKWLLMAHLSAQAIGIAGLLNFGQPVGQIMIIIGYGSSFGIFLVLVIVTWPRFFGRKHLGAISGLSTSIMVFASALGPVLVSVIHDLTGSYREVIIIYWFIPIAIMLAAIKANNPQNKLRMNGSKYP
ncbi:MAG: MFS transporter [Planctomycetota bacterium]